MKQKTDRRLGTAQAENTRIFLGDGEHSLRGLIVQSKRPPSKKMAAFIERNQQDLKRRRENAEVYLSQSRPEKLESTQWRGIPPVDFSRSDNQRAHREALIKMHLDKLRRMKTTLTTHDKTQRALTCRFRKHSKYKKEDIARRLYHENRMKNQKIEEILMRPSEKALTSSDTFSILLIDKAFQNEERRRLIIALSWHRKKRQEKIAKENKIISKRIMERKSQFSRKQWEAEFDFHNTVLRRASKRNKVKLRQHNRLELGSRGRKLHGKAASSPSVLSRIQSMSRRPTTPPEKREVLPERPLEMQKAINTPHEQDHVAVLSFNGKYNLHSSGQNSSRKSSRTRQNKLLRNAALASLSAEKWEGQQRKGSRTGRAGTPLPEPTSQASRVRNLTAATKEGMDTEMNLYGKSGLRKCQNEMLRIMPESARLPESSLQDSSRPTEKQIQREG
eukprot:jgi/Bigna1/143490/aug1.79_g18198